MYIINTYNLVKYFGSIKALDNLDLHIPKGISGFIGPNGAGKTTTINILAGLVSPTDGYAEILGMNSQSESIEIRKSVRFMLESLVLPKEISVIKFMEHAADFCGVSFTEVNNILNEVNLSRFKNRRIKSLSAGMLQRLRLAQALLGNPELIVLDEPTANLDPISRIEVLELIIRFNREKGISFLISSHIIPELEKIIDWVSIINEGKIIAEGNIYDLLKSNVRHNVFRVFSSNNKLLCEKLKEYGLYVDGNEKFIIVESKDNWYFYRILSYLSKYNIHIYKIENVGYTLEDVFKAMVKKDEDIKAN